jgi:hypothetical protein
LNRFLDAWDRNGSTNGPTPWQIYVDDNNKRMIYMLFSKGCTKRGNVALTLSDPSSNLFRQYDFPVLLRCRKMSDMAFFLLRLFARCRCLSNAFIYIVRTLANR